MHDCGNCRGIKLMSHTLKIRERIIERRLRDEQFGFMPGRGTVMQYSRCGNVWRNTYIIVKKSGGARGRREFQIIR